MDLVKNENRLKNILILDKEDNPEKFINVLKCDLIMVLKNYMEISGDDLDVNLTIDEYGCFIFNAYSKVKRLKNLTAITKWY